MNEMNTNLILLKNRLENAIKCRCWRTTCARIRDIAKLREREEGVPFEDSLREYEYYSYENLINKNLER